MTKRAEFCDLGYLSSESSLLISSCNNQHLGQLKVKLLLKHTRTADRGRHSYDYFDWPENSWIDIPRLKILSLIPMLEVVIIEGRDRKYELVSVSDVLLLL